MVMYAQLIQGGTTPELRTDMDRIVTDKLVPALCEEPGYTGALNLVDRESGNALMIVLWNSEDQAERELSQYGGDFLKALGHVMAISTGTRAPIRVGGQRETCGRSTRRTDGRPVRPVGSGRGCG
jgi:hypothetical protein